MSYLGYPDFFEPYIKNVEQTRPARVQRRREAAEESAAKDEGNQGT